MKYFCFLMSLTVFSSAHAATRSFFLPEQALVIVQSIDLQTGTTDDDPYRLYDELLIPPKQSPSGDEGKILENSNKTFVLTCVERKSTGTKQCQFIIRPDTSTHINPILGSASFKVTGSEASGIGKNFLPPGEPSYRFQTQDLKLTIEVKPDRFEFKFQ